MQTVYAVVFQSGWLIDRIKPFHEWRNISEADTEVVGSVKGFASVGEVVEKGLFTVPRDIQKA